MSSCRYCFLLYIFKFSRSDFIGRMRLVFYPFMVNRVIKIERVGNKIKI